MVAVIFFFCSLTNVILNTLKSLVLMRCNSKITNSIINAITYGFYTIVLKQVAEVDLTTSVIITIISNLLGVYISMVIMDKFTKKDKLWKYSVTTKNAIKNKELISELLKKGISYSAYHTEYNSKKYFSIDIFCKNVTDKKITKILLEDLGITKFYITEIDN